MISAANRAKKSPPALEISASRQFTTWLTEQSISLAFSTYQTGKLFLIGLGPERRLSVFELLLSAAWVYGLAPIAYT